MGSRDVWLLGGGGRGCAFAVALLSMRGDRCATIVVFLFEHHGSSEELEEVGQTLFVVPEGMSVDVQHRLPPILLHEHKF